MIVRINQNLYKLYEDSNLDVEVCLNWILGYVNIAFSKKIKYDIINIDLNNNIEKELPASLVSNILKHISTEYDFEKIVNILLLNAYLLGGNE